MTDIQVWALMFISLSIGLFIGAIFGGLFLDKDKIIEED